MSPVRRRLPRILMNGSVGLFVVSSSMAQQPPTPVDATPPHTAAPAPSASQPLATPPPAPPAPQPSAAPAPPASVLVHLRADNPNAALQLRPLSAQRDGSLAQRDGWVPACLAPCGVFLDASLPLRVGGADIAATGPFKVPEGVREVTVHARTGSAGRASWGEALVLTGVGTLLLGAITLGTLGQAGVFKNSEPGDFGSTMMTVSITTMSLGAVLLAIGIPVRWGSGTSLRLEHAGVPRNR